MPNSQIDLILKAQHPDPFAFLGLHGRDKITLRAFLPHAIKVTALQEGQEFKLKAQHSAGFFSGHLPSRAPYLLGVEYENGLKEIIDDPYRFPPYLGELDLHLIKEGRHQRLFEKLGAQKVVLEGVEGINFALWAPNASHVSLVGNFNFWDGRKYPMRRHPDAGIWEIFIPNLKPGAIYKYEIKDQAGNILPLKADPLAFAAELAPGTASIVQDSLDFAWEDQDWLERRGETSATHAPISIYEVHLGSWRRKEGNQRLSYVELAHQLADYVKELGFTHVELLPIHEYPFDGSWGYQPLGLFAPTRRYGTPEDFAYFVNHMHKNGIGVIIDWVAGHFPADAHGLANFDGTCLYEHEDPRQGRHKDWDTLIYNYGRNEVVNFLISNALFWLERFHIDGLRADAVASMLYLDYSRKEGEWIPNRYGGRENLEAVAFLKQLNEAIYAQHPNTLTIAEESTAWPMVSRPTYMGGLGFGYKWNMGWMHDTLDYLSRPPIYRQYHQNELTFGILYAFSENFVLPLSHDEVVHGKGSLVRKMPGDDWQRFANLRLCYSLMFTMPGKKLLFMGGEFAQEKEWDHDVSLDWHLLSDPFHQGIKTMVRDLNRLYREHPPLHQKDCEPEGFQWVDCHDAAQSVIAFLRKDASGRALLIVGNFTPVVRDAYRLGVPYPGQWREIFNSDAPPYGGSGVGNWAKEAEDIAAHGFNQSLQLILPPLGFVILSV